MYVHANGDQRSPLELRELAAPTHEDIAEVAARTAAHPPARPRAADATDEPIAEVRGINIHGKIMQKLRIPSGRSERTRP